MADIFLSYARKDLESVRPLAELLEQQRWTVFWDRHLEPGGKWPDVLEVELTRAGCVVVAWSKASIASRWVRKEAKSGIQRSVLIPARLEDVAPPPGFKDLHAADLMRWDGTPEAAEFQGLVQAIHKKIGGRGDVSMDPTSLVVVVGDPETYRGVGPILNLTCEFSNESDLPVVIRRLELEGQGPEEREYHLRWHLFYGTEGRQQTKIDASARIELPPGETKELGIQFQGPLLGGGELWPIGDYAFELLGWAYGRPPGAKANLTTEFRATLSAPDAAWLRHWQNIESHAWDDPSITDRAVGIPFPMHDIKLAR
jgi:TIR domain